MGVFLIPFYLFAQTQKHTEYDVQAAYIEKFTRFFEWPDYVHIKDTTKPLIIGIVGKTPVSRSLRYLYDKHKILNKNVEIKKVLNLNDATICNILYISQTEYKNIDKIMNSVKGTPILTICDDKRYFKKGVLIVFFTENDYVYFGIDKEAVKQSGLYMNSLLYELSKTIK